MPKKTSGLPPAEGELAAFDKRLDDFDIRLGQVEAAQKAMAAAEKRRNAKKSKATPSPKEEPRPDPPKPAPKKEISWWDD